MNNVTINKQIKLSEHFTLGELCKTSAKTADGNIPSHVHIENLKRLCGWLEMLCNMAPLRSQTIRQSKKCEVDGFINKTK